MTNSKKYIALVFIVVLSLAAKAQQTVQFSQYVFNGLAVNPAYAGYREQWQATLSYRAQWTGFDGAPRTATASFDGLTNNEEKKVGLGFVATTDRLGAQSTSSVYGNYAYRLQLDAYDNRRLSFGIAFGATQYGIDGTKLHAIDEGDASIPVGVDSKVSPDIRFGVYYSSSRFYLGLSALDLFSKMSNQITTESNFKILKQVQHLYFTGGYLLPLSESLDLKPTFMIKEDFKGPTNLDLNTYLLIHKKIWIGASWRTGVSLWNKSNLQQGLTKSDALSAIAELFVSDRFRVGYSFDYTTGSLANYQNGTHEISLSIAFPGRYGLPSNPRFF